MKDGILLVEDSQDDAYLIQRAFDHGGWENELQVVPNGEEAIYYLQGVGHYSDRTKFKFPNLLLLDLKMPAVDGFEVLAWVRSQSDFKNLPVVILTDSNFVADANKAYRLGVHSFFVKTPNFRDSVRLCLSMCQYFLAVKAHTDAQMPAPVWPAKRALCPFFATAVEDEVPCFPCAR
jgi:CheY-like chemotaxis protein